MLYKIQGSLLESTVTEEELVAAVPNNYFILRVNIYSSLIMLMLLPKDLL